MEMQQWEASSDINSLKTNLEDERMALAELEGEYFELHHACDLQVDLPFSIEEAESRLLSLAAQIEQQRTLVEDLEFSLMEAELKVSECTPFDLTDSISDSLASTRLDEVRNDKLDVQNHNPPERGATSSSKEKLMTLSSFDTHLIDFDSKLTNFNSKLIEFDSTLASLSSPQNNANSTVSIVNGHQVLTHCKSSNGDSQHSLTPRANSTSTVHGVSAPNGDAPPSGASQRSTTTMQSTDTLPNTTCPAAPSQPTSRCSPPSSISKDIHRETNVSTNPNALQVPNAASTHGSSSSLSNSLDLLDDVFESRQSLANHRKSNSHSQANSNSNSVNQVKSDVSRIQDNLALLRRASGLHGDSSSNSFIVPYLDGPNSSNSSQNLAWPNRNANGNGNGNAHSNGNETSGETQQINRVVMLNLRQYVTESCGHDVNAIGVHDQVLVEPARVAGYMQKMGGRIKTWKRRWFVFDTVRRTLSYYAAADLRVLKGMVRFELIEDVYFDHVRACPRRSPNTRLTFCVRTPQRTYFCVAPSLEAMRIWIDVILTACPSFSRSLAFAPAAQLQVPRGAVLK